MINSSDGWMSEARSWLAAPCTYTSARCLSSRVKALQVGRGGSSRTGFILMNLHDSAIFLVFRGSWTTRLRSGPPCRASARF